MTEKLHYTLAKLTTLLPIFMLVMGLRGSAQSPVAAFTYSTNSGCAPLVVVFTDQSTGNPFSWNWDFGNGQLSTARNPVVSYAQPGTYTVKLVVRNSSGIDEEVKTDIINVFPSPTARFTSNLTMACAPTTIQFTDQSTIPPGAGTITGWLWDFGDGTTSSLQNPSHTFSNTGFYTVSLQITSSTGCTNFTSIGRYIRIVSGITADFTFSQPFTCQPPFQISFLDQSSGPGGLTYLWDFGNGSPGSTLQNPNSTYLSAGNYTVSLVVRSDLGCSGTVSKNISINGKTTDFNPPSSICIGQAVTFQNNSSPSPVSSTWDFGDGSTSSQINPLKTFLTGGVYQVRLINNYGNCTDSITKTVTVISQPPVNFTANDTTSCNPPFTVQFTDTSPAASTWLWSFGDGSNSNQQNPSHTYTSSGSFDVTLTITLPGGCSNTITKPQYIKIKSTTVEISNAPAGGCIPFTYSPIPAIESVDSIISYSWDMGVPGAIYNTKLPTHTYTAAGTYTIKLTVTTQTGCIVTVTVPDGVQTGTGPNVDFSFTPNNVCASTPVQFTDLSATSPGANVEWLWMFGDSTISDLQNPQHVFEDTGTLDVKLILSNNGCTDSVTKQIRVLPPVAKFGYSVNCNSRLQVTFLDSSLTNPSFGPISYEWRMGDPANTIIFGTSPPVFTYPAYGTYTATLIVTNGPCSYQSTEQVILVNENPGFTINKNPICKSEIFTLSATGVNASNIEDYTWNIGGSIISDTTFRIDYSLGTYGNYDVTLMVEDINGCTNSTTIPGFITISGPVAGFTPNGPGACINNTIYFTDQSVTAGSPIAQWTWDFGDGNQQTYSAPPFSHVYTQTGNYNVSLIIKDNANCADTVSVPGAVLITDPVAAFKADTVYCPLSPLQFVDTSIGSGLNYTWFFGDGSISNLQNPTHAYAMGDNSYSVKLVIRDMAGCEDSIIKTNYIKIRSPKAAFMIEDSTGICLPLLTTFTFQGSDYQSFNWDFGDGGTSRAQNPSHFYNAYGSFTATLFVVGPGGCIDSAQANINTYNPAANTQILFDPSTACNSITTNFDITTIPNYSFKFYFGDGTHDSSQQTSITHFYPSPGIYYPYLVLTDKFGCEASVGTGPINVYGAIPLFGKDKKEFCDNGEVFFVNYTLNNDPIISSVWDFGDGTTSTATEPSHVYSTPDMYIVTLTVVTQNQCTSSLSDTIRVYKTPELSILGKDTICVNTSETFEGILTVPDSTIQWQWSLGNGSTSQLQNPSAIYGSPGNYSIQLTATNKLGCGDTASHPIVVVPPPTAVPVTNPVTIISGGSAPLNMNYTGSIVSYNWIPAQNLDCSNCPMPVADPQFSTDYRVELVDIHGCSNKGDIRVQVVCTGQNFFVPNTFSPNGDGSNDVFYLRGQGLFRVKSLRVFSRWGEVVFESREFPVNNPAYGWDGRIKGKKAKADVYVYQLEILCSNGELIKYSGNIALLQ